MNPKNVVSYAICVGMVMCGMVVAYHTAVGSVKLICEVFAWLYTKGV